MPLFIKDSIIYKIIYCILIKPYNNSLLKKFLEKTLNCFKESFIYKRVEGYLNKKPYFLNSIVYKFIRKIVKLIDRLMDFLHKIIKKMLLGSVSFSEICSIKDIDNQEKLLILSILIGTFNVAYTVAGIIFDTINLYVSYGLLVITLILFLFSKSKNCFKQSFIYKIFKSW